MTSSRRDKGVFASAERWATLRSEPAFLELVRLARVTNALALVYPPIFVSHDDQSPAARRDRFAAMVYAGALLHEGLHVAQGLGKHFRDLKQYKEGFAKLLGDRGVGKFRTKTLDKVRDKLVFHVDRESIAKGLARYPEGETLIATASDFSQGHSYFDLADEVVLGYLFGDALTADEYLARVESFLGETSDLHSRYMRAAHSLIPAALRRMGCYRRSILRPQPPTDDTG